FGPARSPVPVRRNLRRYQTWTLRPSSCAPFCYQINILLYHPGAFAVAAFVSSGVIYCRCHDPIRFLAVPVPEMVPAAMHFLADVRRKRKPMIERYTRPEMARIWSEDNKIATWLRVEVLVCEAWAQEGVIPI